MSGNNDNSSLQDMAPDEEAVIVAPDYSLKKKIGENIDLKEVFSAENVEKAQAVIEEHTNNFLDWVKGDLVTLETHYTAANADAENSKDAIEKLAKTAFVMKSQAGMFGYTLATTVAKSLDDFCRGQYKPIKDHLLIVRKHIDVLQTIFKHDIKGDGNIIGADLMSSLQKLIAKYKGDA